MIMSVEDLRKFITTDESDEQLEMRLVAIESLIRKYTNNNFQSRNIRTATEIIGGELAMDYPLIKDGDTIEISQSLYNDGVYTFSDALTLIDEPAVLVTKVVYPPDIKMGVVSMLKWDMENREKVGIQSESLSRHSVTYFNMDGDNSSVGYPKYLTGFLKPYIKARF